MELALPVKDNGIDTLLSHLYRYRMIPTPTTSLQVKACKVVVYCGQTRRCHCLTTSSATVTHVVIAVMTHVRTMVKNRDDQSRISIAMIVMHAPGLPSSLTLCAKRSYNLCLPRLFLCRFLPFVLLALLCRPTPCISLNRSISSCIWGQDFTHG